jgi:hypothetical protein
MFMLALWNYPFLRFSFIACFAYRIIQDAQGWEKSVAKTLSVAALQSKTNDNSTSSFA